MGKSKKRNFSKNSTNKGSVYKRTDVISSIISDIQNNSITEKTKHHISLFGITAEELTESGITLEELSLVKHLFF